MGARKQGSDMLLPASKRKACTMEEQKPRFFKEEQLDLFNDFDEARVFTCIAGAYIGKFNQDDPENPVTRLSEFMHEDEAQKVLMSGAWSAPDEFDL